MSEFTGNDQSNLFAIINNRNSRGKLNSIVKKVIFFPSCTSEYAACEIYSYSINVTDANNNYF